LEKENRKTVIITLGAGDIPKVASAICESLNLKKE